MDIYLLHIVIWMTADLFEGLKYISSCFPCMWCFVSNFRLLLRLNILSLSCALGILAIIWCFSGHRAKNDFVLVILLLPSFMCWDYNMHGHVQLSSSRFEIFGVIEMTPWLRAYAVLAEDWVWILASMSHDSQPPANPTPSSSFYIQWKKHIIYFTRDNGVF